ncbi:MAG: hypothetical protein UT01_C0056G0012, partial [Candidatus Daviesbacteria bacterium GW2011_GWA1_38_7]
FQHPRIERLRGLQAAANAEKKKDTGILERIGPKSGLANAHSGGLQGRGRDSSEHHLGNRIAGRCDPAKGRGHHRGGDQQPLVDGKPDQATERQALPSDEDYGVLVVAIVEIKAMFLN